jgi:hypothetical protein
VPYPDISYHADGTVITPGSVGELEVRQLTSDGLAAVLDRAAASGLLDRDGRQFSALLPFRGLTATTVEARLPGSGRTRVSAFANAPAAGAAAAFLNLAEALASPADWLPADAWVGEPTPYVADRVRVMTTLEDVSDPAPAHVDIASVAWPLDTPFDGLGEVLSDEPGYLVRCAVLPAADADAIRRALVAAGAVPDRDWTGTIPLRYGDDRAISYAFAGQLPDGVPSCTPPSADAAWSIDGEIGYVRESSSPVVRLWGVPDGSEPVVARGQGPAWSPDGSSIATIRPRRDDLPDLWVTEVADGDADRIVVTAVSAAWSPRGDLLAVSRSPIDVGDLWLVEPDGTGLHELREGGGQVAWSPDATRLAVVTGTGSPTVGVLDVASGRRVDLLPGTNPTWTREQRPRIACVGWGTDDIVVVDPATGAAERVATAPGPVEQLVTVEAPGRPGWALAFVSAGTAWILDGLHDPPRPLSAPGEVAGGVSALPGGAWLATVVRTVTGTDLVALQADGDGWFQLTDLGDVTEAAARPAP